jgi:PLP dependent protein
LSSYNSIKKVIDHNSAVLVAVSKTKPVSLIQEIYNEGQRIFGENRVQELLEKWEQLPKDIQWHLIGTLQKNKVKYVAPFLEYIHSVDSLELAQIINKEAIKNNRKINCLLQIYIAKEDTKQGFEIEELMDGLMKKELQNLEGIIWRGVMGMASFVDDNDVIRSEFKKLKSIFDTLKQNYFGQSTHFDQISMGMSGDYEIALEEGATMVRIGSAIFGGRG